MHYMCDIKILDPRSSNFRNQILLLRKFDYGNWANTQSYFKMRLKNLTLINGYAHQNTL